MNAVLRAALVGLFVVTGVANAFAQLPPEDQPQPPRRGGARNPNMPSGPPIEDVYRELDAFVMRQAHVVLELPMGDPQSVEFARRLTHLQMVQRRHRNQRQRVLMQLRQLAGPNAPAPDDIAITETVKELDTLEAQFQAQERQALIAIDVVLEPHKRGRFRIFLENMERRKLDLLMQAQQGRGQRPGGQRPAGQAPIR